jgi:hypothetical protein
MTDMNSSDEHQNDEVIIAQEQGAVYKSSSKNEKVEGTLILTNERLIFACANEKTMSLTHDLEDENKERGVEDEVKDIYLDIEGVGGELFYSEIEDLGRITQDPKNLFIPLSEIVSVEGEKGRLLEKPRLKVSWKNKDSGELQSQEFWESLTGPGRKKNLNDWAAVIEQLRSKKLAVQKLPQAPSKDTLEGKIAYMMGDMQEKGSAVIQQQVEEAFKIELDPDDVERSCENLVSMGYLEKVPNSAEPFYRKRSPVGINWLSS